MENKNFTLAEKAAVYDFNNCFNIMEEAFEKSGFSSQDFHENVFDAYTSNSISRRAFDEILRLRPIRNKCIHKSYAQVFKNTFRDAVRVRDLVVFELADQSTFRSEDSVDFINESIISVPNGMEDFNVTAGDDFEMDSQKVSKIPETLKTKTARTKNTAKKRKAKGTTSDFVITTLISLPIVVFASLMFVAGLKDEDA